MSEEKVPEEVKENVPDPVADTVEEKVPEVVKEMPPKKKEEETPTITNPEPVQDASATSSKVNKKLSTMSKNTKEKQKNRKLPKPTVSRPPPSTMSLDINPMYLLGILGVIIAGASLWYQRKSFLKEEDERSGDSDSAPVQSTGEDTAKKPSPKKKQPFDPWEWKREHTQTGVFPGNYDFD